MSVLMTEKQLRQYKFLRREIAQLDERIWETELNSSEKGVIDTVMSAAEFPYNKRPVAVIGYGSKRLPKLYDAKRTREAECERIEEFVESVEDSLMRQLLTCRYIEGMKLCETAFIVGYSESQAKRLLSAFFQKMSSNELK